MTLEEKLYAAIQAYAKDVTKQPIVYTPDANPYFFIDTNGNGKADEDEANSDNRYADWTPRLLRAAYNYQYVQKDPAPSRTTRSTSARSSTTHWKI